MCQLYKIVSEASIAISSFAHLNWNQYRELFSCSLRSHFFNCETLISRVSRNSCSNLAPLLPLFLMLNTSRSHFAQQRFIEGVDTTNPALQASLSAQTRAKTKTNRPRHIPRIYDIHITSLFSLANSTKKSVQMFVHLLSNKCLHSKIPEFPRFHSFFFRIVESVFLES